MNQSSFLIYRVGISEMQPHQSANTFIQGQPKGSLHNIVLCKHYLHRQGFALTITWPFPVSFVALKRQEILACIMQRYLDVMKGQETGKTCLL